MTSQDQTGGRRRPPNLAARAPTRLGLVLAAAVLMAPGLLLAQPSQFPPRVALGAGPLEQVLLSPIFRQRFFCMEHALGESVYAGDALGTDCQIADGADADPQADPAWRGFLKLYRSDGRRNEDWYGWHAEVLSPVTGTVMLVSQSVGENTPGVLSPPPGGAITIRTADGVVVLLGHLTAITVAEGTPVEAGQVIGRVGNNGQSRAPHTHVGAYREAGAVPLQVRWDLRAMGELRRSSGDPGRDAEAGKNEAPRADDGRGATLGHAHSLGADHGR